MHRLFVGDSTSDVDGYEFANALTLLAASDDLHPRGER